MKKFIPVFLMMLLTAGCGDVRGWFDQIGGGSSGQSGRSTASSPKQQLNDARASFDQKLQNAQGRSLAEVRKDWGRLEPGLKRGDLTVYQWRQTAKITTPKGEVAPASSRGASTASCLAMFIVGPGDVVVDSTAEGQCYDFRRMPAWQPTVTQSTDGRLGPAY